MILSRWDRPGQSAQCARLIILGPRARVARCQCSSDIHESRGAHTCFRMRVSRMVHYGPHQAVSDATPIARGNAPLTTYNKTARLLPFSSVNRNFKFEDWQHSSPLVPRVSKVTVPSPVGACQWVLCHPCSSLCTSCVNPVSTPLAGASDIAEIHWHTDWQPTSGCH
jgi:hypothetical protein